MTGSWVGYVYVIVGCGSCVGIVLLSTVLLYVVARLRAGREAAVRVRVTSVSRRPDRSEAP